MPFATSLFLAISAFSTVPVVDGLPGSRLASVEVGADGMPKSRETSEFGPFSDSESLAQETVDVEVDAVGGAIRVGAVSEAEPFVDDQSLLQTQVLSTKRAVKVPDEQEDAFVIDTNPVFLLQDGFRLITEASEGQ
mmetsp:Transcript_43417/g.129675  ORF Transcript_43417/g.129675 Transcript_43417/m.129675 type:complete len:136 (+) Transcript_43417:61-468(+)